MLVYLDMVMALNFAVDLLLLLGTNRLTGFPPEYKRSVAAAGVGAVYAGLAMVPQFRFLGNTLWRIIFLSLISMIAFGWNRSALQRGAVFVMLSMALGGIAMGIGMVDFGTLCICATVLWLLCRIGFRGKLGQMEYTTVELNWSGNKVRLLALKDTGNTLRDPLTGEQVLVCGADVGEELLGIDRGCFSKPYETLCSSAVPGMRLIPYHSVGQPGSMMLALRLKNIRIGQRTMDSLVAFAPREIAGEEGYRMLAGGIE